MLANRIRGMVEQYCWAVGHYRSTQPILDCIDQILSNWQYREHVQVFVTQWRLNGMHLHTKALVKIGSGVYPVILSETVELDVLSFTKNDITYLLVSVIEETEQELQKLTSSGVEVTDPLAVMLQEMEQMHDDFLY
jgi:hypothetical protein